MSLPHPKYRPDIDGLRALAVLGVLIFHAFPKFLRGGFIGVDVFFVISGFLISTIIYEGLERNEFSFREFYARRIRRIFPALIVVMLATFAAGWFLIFPDAYKQLGKHMIGGALFVSNFVLWKESGYFDAAAETKPLLHLWSLGIEEQYYMFFPLVIWLAWRARLNLITVVTLIAGISFALNIGRVYQDPNGAFYQPQYRFWELMLGALLAQITLHYPRYLAMAEHWIEPWAAKVILRPNISFAQGSMIANLKSWVGFALIIAGYIILNQDVKFPGKAALLPTIGACLIIWAGPQAFVNRHVLSNRVALFLGKVSYPLYLWHWPILVYLRMLDENNHPHTSEKLGALALSVLLAWLTYRYIEKPIRFGRTAPDASMKRAA